MFLYQPKSGDRVFAESKTSVTPQGLVHEANEVCVMRYPNGCRHVFGTQFILSTAGGSIRRVARKVAERIVKLYGGLAIDEQGCVSVVTSKAGIRRAFEMAKLVCLDANYNDSGLLLEGITTFDHAGECRLEYDPEPKGDKLRLSNGGWYWGPVPQPDENGNCKERRCLHAVERQIPNADSWSHLTTIAAPCSWLGIDEPVAEGGPAEGDAVVGVRYDDTTDGDW